MRQPLRFRPRGRERGTSCPVTPRAGSRSSAFLRDRAGNVAMMTALLALPIIGLVGLAIDHVVLSGGKTKFDQAADAAALAAVKAASQSIQGGSSDTVAFAAGKQVGKKIFKGNAGESYAVEGTTPQISITRSGNTLTSTVTYTTSGTTSFGKLFGTSSAGVGGKSSATLSLPTYINIYIMVDTSGSMAIGASAADQQALINSPVNCAFACHDGNPVGGYSDAYAYAEGKGIQLRYDVVNTGIRNFLSTIDNTDPAHKYIQASIYTFDSTLKNVVGSPGLTSNTNLLRQRLPTAPATSGEYDGATHFNEAIPTVMNDIGNGGDGSSPTAAKKLLIIATDGVQDPNRTWTDNTSLRPQVQVIDTSFCPTVKGRGVTVGFIHMPYLPMAWDWGYMATLGQPANDGTSRTRVDLVQPALKACADDYYTLAADTTSLSNAFVKIFQSYMAVRLIN